MAVLTGFVVLLHVVTCVTGNIIDLTCFALAPTVDREGDDDVIIGGYKSGEDTDIDVEFGRESFTGTGDGLPFASTQYDHSSGRDVAELLRLPGSAGRERIGAFYCQATKYGFTETIVTTILASFANNRYVSPDHVSITANMGESVTLSVTTKDHITISALRWRHNSGNVMSDGEPSHTISSVLKDDAGVYECYSSGYRNGNHAIMQLIVRACTAGRWDPPTCNNACPHCYNGGICDDRSGLCVCAPGFSGTYCQTVLGSNRWGQDGQRVCSTSNGNDPHSAACRGALFCLPHPYGCTCAAGYNGIECDQECQEGTYGANCRSQCHCADGVSCLRDTGECLGGGCHPDWYGVNCQVPCPDQRTRRVTDLQGKAAAANIVVQWEPETAPCSYFILTYDVSDNLDECRQVEHSQEHLSTSNQFEISNLQYYSTYTITVRIRGSQTSDSVTVMTEQTVPDFLPSVSTTVETTYTGLTFSRNPVPCASIRGTGFHYKYRFQNDIRTTEATSMSFSNLISCTEYQFEVWSANSVGESQRGMTIATTRTTVPGPVNHLIATSPSSTELLLTWHPSTENNCVETGYTVVFQLVNKDQCEVFHTSVAIWENANPGFVYYLTSTLNTLRPYSTYNVSVTTRGTAGLGKSVYVVQTTNTSKPSAPPSDIIIGEVTPDTFVVYLAKPSCGTRHGEIASYSFILTTTNSTVVTHGETSSPELVIANITPFTTYNLQVAAVTNAGEGPLSEPLSITTKQADIPVPRKIQDIDDAQLTSRTFTITLPNIGTKYVTGYQVGVEIKETQRKRQVRRFGHYFDSKAAYIAAELALDDVIGDSTFVVGDGEVYGEYYNAPLKENQTYTLYVALIRRTNSTAYFATWSQGTDVTTRSCSIDISSSTDTNSQNGTAQITIAIFVSLLCISAIAIVAMAYYILRSKNKQLKQDNNQPTITAPPTIINPGSGERIQMSVDGYVEYKHDQPESTYQGIKEDVQGDDTYDEIPVSINTTNLVSPDNVNQDDGAYTKDSVIQPVASKSPQQKPDQAGIYEVSM